MKVIEAKDSITIDINRLTVKDMFKFPKASSSDTRYMVVEHVRHTNKYHDIIHYLCINTGIIYNRRRFEPKYVIRVKMEAKDV